MTSVTDRPPIAPGRIPLIDLTAMSHAVQPALDALWEDLTETSAFIGGGYVDAFETSWARYCGTKTAVGLGNGTDALELTLRGLGVGPSDEIILPANTFIATAEAVVLAGATPRFVDVNPQTLLMSADCVEAALTRRTAAIIVVHMYGAMAELDSLKTLCERKGLVLIEDAAQAHGALWSGRRAGSWGTVGCFSFYPGKNLGAFGDGGAVATHDEGLAARIRQLANHGRPPNTGHVHSVIARNSRLDALQAGVLSAKLPFLDEWNGRRRTLMEYYRSRVSSVQAEFVTIDPRCTPVYHQNVVQVPHRDTVMALLRDQGIETGIHYRIPCHLQEPYRKYAFEPCPMAESAAQKILSLPLYPHMTIEAVDTVATALAHALEEVGGRSH
jgi:dTDP-4-amino-4,6-dideoxygalactose transaminase